MTNLGKSLEDFADIRTPTSLLLDSLVAIESLGRAYDTGDDAIYIRQLRCVENARNAIIAEKFNRQLPDELHISREG